MTTINDEIGLKTGLQWRCENCGALNDASEKVCLKCGNPYAALNDKKSTSKETAQTEDVVNLEGTKPSTPESVLETVSTIVLWAGILAGVVLFFIGKYMIDNSEEAVGYTLLVAIIPTVLSSVVVWALLRVLCNISNNLNEMNKKLNA